MDRALAMLLRAPSFFLGGRTRSTFVETEAEARAWLDAQRAQVTGSDANPAE
jgi:hypothetical protein